MPKCEGGSHGEIGAIGMGVWNVSGESVKCQ